MNLRQMLGPKLKNLEIDEPRNFSDRDRLELFEIGDEQRRALESAPFRRVSVESPPNFRYEEIDLANLHGINRGGLATNWIEQLFELNKQVNFYFFNSRKSIEAYAKRLNAQCADLPHVVEIEKRYFIDSNGKHRLTIAKCAGLELFPVLVSQCSELSTFGGS